MVKLKYLTWVIRWDNRLSNEALLKATFHVCSLLHMKPINAAAFGFGQGGEAIQLDRLPLLAWRSERCCC